MDDVSALVMLLVMSVLVASMLLVMSVMLERVLAMMVMTMPVQDELMLLTAMMAVMMLVGMMVMLRLAVSVAVLTEVVLVVGDWWTAVTLEQRLKQVVLQKVKVPSQRLRKQLDATGTTQKKLCGFGLQHNGMQNSTLVGRWRGLA